MKIMSYNIWNGGLDRLPLILKTIKREAPDVLAIQEANTFTEKNNQIIKQFSSELSLPYYDISLSKENYHVASFSKYEFKKVKKIPRFRDAALQTVVETELGEISICNTHLHPFFEEKALAEIESVISSQKAYQNKIVLGDFNSLSPEDDYLLSLMDKFNQIQLTKFTQNNRFRSKVITTLLSNDYIDSAVILNKNNINTVPAKANEDDAHTALLRLDDIFISKSLAPSLKAFDVIKTADSDLASDHYPVTAELTS